jgi:hypothetical protein
VWYLTLASLFVFAEFGLAYQDGYAFAWQVRKLTDAPNKFLDFFRHGGMWGDFFIVNPILAHLLSEHAHFWSLHALATILTVTAFLGALLLIPVLKDSLLVPSAFARNQLLTIVGAMHLLYFVVGTSVSLMFYLFTPSDEVKKIEVIIVTICLMLHWGLGVLQPPWIVHRSIHLPAKVITAAGWAFLLILAGRRLHEVYL